MVLRKSAKQAVKPGSTEPSANAGSSVAAVSSASAISAAPSRNGSFAKELLKRAHARDEVDEIFRKNVLHRPLELTPTEGAHKPLEKANHGKQELNARDLRRIERENKRRKRMKKPWPPLTSSALSSIPQGGGTARLKPLSANQKRRLGLLDLPKSQTKYTIYEPLHRLWLGYMHELLGLGAYLVSLQNPGGKNAAFGSEEWCAREFGPRLASADLHGALLQVVRCRCTSRVGLSGIVVRETKSAVEIVTKGDEVKVVPKEHTLFRIAIPLSLNGETDKELGLVIHGDQFNVRPADRATKKFKLRNFKDY